MKRASFLKGQQFEVVFPFVTVTIELDREDGPFDSWKPGTRCETVSDAKEQNDVADGQGKMILTVVDVFKPGKYPERVFFTRAFVDPDGKSFGKGKLRMTTTSTFRRLICGYRYPYLGPTVEL